MNIKALAASFSFARRNERPMGEAWGWLPVLAIALAVWGMTDVRNRGVVDASNPLDHRTDFTVYTEAGAAFFDGRDPYEVTNPRGWHYLYPPMFAMAVAPLAKFPETTQVVAWFGISCLLCWGMYRECRRLLLVVFPQKKTAEAGRLSPRIHFVLRTVAIVTVAFPVLNCLQRGQVGAAVLYPLLLGARLILQNTGAVRTLVGGLILAVPVVLKLTPLLPAGFLLLLLAADWARKRTQESWRRAGIASTSFAAGVATLLLFIPAALVGWDENISHLRSWQVQFVMNPLRGEALAFNARAKRNQSVDNAVYRLGNWIAYAAGRGPHDSVVDQIGFDGSAQRMPMDAAIVGVCLKGLKLGLLSLLLAAGWRAVQCEGTSAQAACFGLACALSLFISPISWGHHYMYLLPAALFVPPFLAERGRLRTAIAASVVPAILVIAHYASVRWAGRAGLLGIGSGIWLTFTITAVLRAARVETASAAQSPALSTLAPNLKRAA